MALVRVWSNTYLNTDCVGKVELQPTFNDESRTNTTTVYDLTSQNILLTAVSTVAIGSSVIDKDQVARDNFIHSEIVVSIQEKKDAREWRKSAEALG